MKNRLYSNWTSKVPCYVVEKLFNKHPSGLLDRFATALKTQKLFGSNSHRREMEKKQARHPNKYSDNIQAFWHNHNNHPQSALFPSLPSTLQGAWVHNDTWNISTSSVSATCQNTRRRQADIIRRYIYSTISRISIIQG